MLTAPSPESQLLSAPGEWESLASDGGKDQGKTVSTADFSVSVFLKKNIHTHRSLIHDLQNLYPHTSPQRSLQGKMQQETLAMGEEHAWSSGFTGVKTG